MVGFVDKLSIGFPFDGGDMAGTSYQMVPLGGRRDLIFQTEGNPCVLTVEDSSTATMENFRFFGTGTTLSAGVVQQIQLPPKAIIRFSVVGIAPGFTSLKFVDVTPDFTISGDLTISVKRQRPVRFCFVFLADLIHKNVRGQIDPRSLMNVVSKLYSAQANVDLQEFGSLLDVTVTTDLGNPIFTSDDDVLDAIEAATSEETFNKVDFIVYCVWNVEHERGKHDDRGVTINPLHREGRKHLYAFIEVTKTGFLGQVHVLAHEIGHVLGLRHTNDNGLMFFNLRTLSNRLFFPEIETINPLFSPTFP